MIYSLIPICVILLAKYAVLKHDYKILELNYKILNEKMSEKEE